MVDRQRIGFTPAIDRLWDAYADGCGMMKDVIAGSDDGIMAKQVGGDGGGQIVTRLLTEGRYSEFA